MNGQRGEQLRTCTAATLALAALAGCPHAAPTGVPAARRSAPGVGVTALSPMPGTSAGSGPSSPVPVLAPTTSPGPLGSSTPGPNTPTPTPGVATPAPVLASIVSTYGNGVITLADAGILANNGAGITGTVKATAGILSTYGNGVLSTYGNGLVSDQGGGYHVLAAPAQVRESGGYRLLAAPAQVPVGGATVSLLDGVGHRVVDAAGKPITAKTDAQGRYAFPGLEGSHNGLVAVDLGQGGLLQAICPAHAASQARAVDLELVSSLTTGYIMSQYVLSQADPRPVLDRLPAAVEADTRAKAAAALAGQTALPDRLTATSVTLAVTSLRTRDRTLDDQLEAVRKLLLVGGSASQTDGSATAAQIALPAAVALDPQGNMYISDTANHLIRMLTTAGNLVTIAGNGNPGSLDGTGTAATFNAPGAMALDAHDPAHPALYVSDGHVRRLGLENPQQPVVTTLPPFNVTLSVLGSPTPSQISTPAGLAFDAHGGLFMTNFSAVFFQPPGGALGLLAGGFGQSSWADGIGAAASFFVTRGVTVDAAGNAYVVDQMNRRIRKVASDGTVTTLAGSGQRGEADGPGAQASFYQPEGIAVDGAGNVYVTDQGGPFLGQHQVGNKVRKITPDHTVSTLAGAGPPGNADGPGASAGFQAPSGLVATADGTLYVADTLNNVVRKITPAGVVSTVVGSGKGSFGNGTGTNALLDRPAALALDAHGTLYVADTLNQVIRSIDATGTVATFAGTPGTSGDADGPAASAGFNTPSGLVFDAAGTHLYVVDGGNNRLRSIAMTDPAHTVSTLAGGEAGLADGPGVQAMFNHPWGICLGPQGDLIVADAGNFAVRRVAMADPAHPVVSTLAGGQSEGFADGVGPAALFLNVLAVATDPAGVIYALDAGGNAVRRVASDGTVTTIAGGLHGGGLADGTGAAASFLYPAALIAAPGGGFYVGDMLDNAIRKVTPQGVVTTASTLVAGDPNAVQGPSGLALAPDGTLYVSQNYLNQVKGIKLTQP